MNELILPVSELKSALSGFGKIIIKRTALPVLSHFRLTRTSQGDVNLEATDLDSHAVYRLSESREGAPMDVLIPFEPVNKLVKGMASKVHIRFALDGKKQLMVKYPLGGSMMEQKLETLPVNEFPPLPKINRPDIQVGPEFGVALKQSLACCSQDESRSALRGAYLDVADKQFHYLVGTDGKALFAANSFALDLQKSVIIPDSKFLNWTDLMDEGCKLTVEPPPKKTGKSVIQFKSDRWTFMTREVDTQFPNWKQCVPAMASPKTVIRLPVQAVKQLLEVIPHLPGSTEINHTIRLRYEFNQFKVEGRTEKNDWTGVFIQDADINGKPVTIGLNREYLLQALKFNLNEIRIEDALSPLVCVSGGKKMVIMPVKLEFPPNTPPAKTSPTPPPQPQPNAAASTERKTDMPRATQKHESQATANQSQPALIDHVEKIKDTLKTVIRDLNELVDAVKLAEKEQRATEKEVESARATLKKLQQVSL